MQKRRDRSVDSDPFISIHVSVSFSLFLSLSLSLYFSLCLSLSIYLCLSVCDSVVLYFLQLYILGTIDRCSVLQPAGIRSQGSAATSNQYILRYIPQPASSWGSAADREQTPNGYLREREDQGQRERGRGELEKERERKKDKKTRNMETRELERRKRRRIDRDPEIAGK